MDTRFTPEGEAAADRVLACAGFPVPPASTSAETSPGHVPEAVCSPDMPVPAGNKSGASDSAQQVRGVAHVKSMFDAQLMGNGRSVGQEQDVQS